MLRLCTEPPWFDSSSRDSGQDWKIPSMMLVAACGQCKCVLEDKDRTLSKSAASLMIFHDKTHKCIGTLEI
eukprot:5685045-Amphidinium_carterae.1